VVVGVFEHTQTVGVRCWVKVLSKSNNHTSIKSWIGAKVVFILWVDYYMSMGIFIGPRPSYFTLNDYFALNINGCSSFYKQGWSGLFYIQVFNSLVLRTEFLDNSCNLDLADFRFQPTSEANFLSFLFCLLICWKWRWNLLAQSNQSWQSQTFIFDMLTSLQANFLTKVIKLVPE
jgi:hypothetical protein